MYRRPRLLGTVGPTGAVASAVVVSAMVLSAQVVDPLAAQEAQLPPQERVELERQLEQLEARMGALDDLESSIREARELQAAKALREIEENGLTETIGPIRIRRPAGTAPVEGVVRVALGDLSRILGAPATLPPTRINLYRPEDLGPLSPPSSETSGTPWYAYSERGLNRLRRNIRGRALATVPSPIGPWSSRAGWTDEHQPLQALRAMAQITAADGVSCFRAGDVGACRRYLSIDEDGSSEALDGAFDRDYTFDQILVFAQGGIRNALLRCMSANRRIGIPLPSTGCFRMVSRTRSGTSFRATPLIRGSLVAYALRRGEPGALDRLRSVPDARTVGDQLEVISGMPVDELLEAWRGDAMNGRGMFEDVGGHPPGPVSLLWAGGFALLALGSTRWRLG